MVATRRSLISRLRNVEDGESWEDFFESYWRLIYSVARKAGLSEVESEDVVQETTIAVSKYIHEYRYDPKVCSFKNWLLHKTRWKIIDQVRKRPPKCVERIAPSAETARPETVEQIPGSPSIEIDGLWEEEWKTNIIDTAMQRIKRRIKPEHYQIFHLSVVRKLAPRKVAQVMGVNVARVYLVRHRVGGLIKQEIQALERRAAEG